jgi:hypothetical protein
MAKPNNNINYKLKFAKKKTGNQITILPVITGRDG